MSHVDVKQAGDRPPMIARKSAWLVLALITLVALVFAFFLGYVWRSLAPTPATRVGPELMAIGMALQLYARDSGAFPPPPSLNVLRQPVLRGPYLTAQVTLTDPWGRPYTYVILPNGNAQVGTLGKDGVPGGVGEDTDWTWIVPATSIAALRGTPAPVAPATAPASSGP